MSKKVEEMALVTANEARALVIETKEDLTRADQLLSMLVDLKKKIDEAYDDIIEAAHASWKKALARKAQYWKPVDDEAKRLKAKIGEFKRKAEEERKLEEDRLTKEAIAAEEERRRIEAEASPEMAAEIMAEPITVAPVVIPNEIKTNARFRTIWAAEVTDFDALIKAVYEGKVSNLALLPNEKFLNEQARSFKNLLNITGVRPFSREV
jgi:hypothetical protein